MSQLVKDLKEIAELYQGPGSVNEGWVERRLLEIISDLEAGEAIGRMSTKNTLADFIRFHGLDNEGPAEDMIQEYYDQREH